MTRSIPIILAFLSIRLLPLAHAEEVASIEVRGTATEKAAVDKVSWTLRIRSVDPALAQAAKSIDECYLSLKGDLEALHIPSLQIRAAEIASGREYERSDDQRKFLGFYAERGLTLTITDVARVSEVQARLLSDERISIGSVYRGSTKELELKAKALEHAAEAARAKAERLAQVLKIKVGRALVVVDGGVSLSGGGSSPILTSNVISQPIFSERRDGAELDEVAVTQTVTIKYAITE